MVWKQGQMSWTCNLQFVSCQDDNGQVHFAELKHIKKQGKKAGHNRGKVQQGKTAKTLSALSERS
jgi:hypothetical protein